MCVICKSLSLFLSLSYKIRNYCHCCAGSIFCLFFLRIICLTASSEKTSCMSKYDHQNDQKHCSSDESCNRQCSSGTAFLFLFGFMTGFRLIIILCIIVIVIIVLLFLKSFDLLLAK